MANSEQRPEPGLRVIPKRDMPKWTPERTAKFKATMANKRGEQRAGSVKPVKPPAHSAQPKKRAETVIISRAHPIADQAKDESSWADWKAGVLAQLEDAEVKLQAKLDAVQRAQGTIREL